MQSFSKYNNGTKYLLTVIDVFSKYAWVVPVPNKEGYKYQIIQHWFRNYQSVPKQS